MPPSWTSFFYRQLLGHHRAKWTSPRNVIWSFRRFSTTRSPRLGLMRERFVRTEAQRVRMREIPRWWPVIMRAAHQLNRFLKTAVRDRFYNTQWIYTSHPKEYGNRAESVQFFILHLILIQITRLLIFIPNFGGKDAALYVAFAPANVFSPAERTAARFARQPEARAVFWQGIPFASRRTHVSKETRSARRISPSPWSSFSRNDKFGPTEWIFQHARNRAQSLSLSAGFRDDDSFLLASPSSKASWLSTPGLPPPARPFFFFSRVLLSFPRAFAFVIDWFVRFLCSPLRDTR